MEESGNEEENELFFGDKIPFDCQYLILEYLPNDRDVIYVASTSKKWSFSVVARSERIWNHKLDEYKKKTFVPPFVEKKFEEEVPETSKPYEKYVSLRYWMWRLKPVKNTFDEMKEKGITFSDIGKVVVEGCGAVGKTCLIIRYAMGIFPEEYVPTVFDCYCYTQKKVDSGKSVSFSLWDNAGQESYDRLRYLSYPQTSIFLLCFSMVNRGSFEDVKDKWYKEMNFRVPEAKIILVGTKSDLKTDEKYLEKMKSWYVENPEPVSREEAEKMVKEIGAETFVETSALTGEGIFELFQEVISVLSDLNKKPRQTNKGSKCIVM